MADLRFDYETLQILIDAFESARSDIETAGYTAAASPESDSDPVMTHHNDQVKPQDSDMITSATTSYSNARDGVQDAHDAFKAADQAGAEGSGEE